VWETQFDGDRSEEDRFYDIGQDESGNIYAVGGSRVLSCDYESGIVRKVSHDGGVMWTDHYVGTGEACEDVQGRAVVVQGEDDLFVLSAQGGAGVTETVSLLRRYGVASEELSEVWSLLEEDWVQRPRGLTIVSGELLLAGKFRGVDYQHANGGLAQVSLDGGFLGGSVVEGPSLVGWITSLSRDSVEGYAVGAVWGDSDDYAVRSYGADGELRWARVLDEVNAGGSDLGGALAYGDDDFLAVCSNGEEGELRVRVYDPSGALQWNSELSFGPDARARCLDIVVDPVTSDVVFCGMFDEYAPLGISSNGNSDAFVARYSSSGDQVWVERFDGLAPSLEGGRDATIAYAVELAADGGILVAGSLGVLDLAGDEYSDAFLWKLVP
jgi:hypothetical protein